MSDSPGNVVEKMVQHFNGHDLDSVYALMSEDHPQYMNGELMATGRDGCRAADAVLYENVPDYSRVTESLMCNGEQVVLRWRLQGRSLVGKAVDWPAVSCMRVANGLIKESRIYGDPAVLREALTE